MTRGITSIAITAVVAGVIGSGAGVYLVPNEKADQFRTMANKKAGQFSAMVHSGLGAVYRAVYTDNGNAEFHPLEPSHTNSSGEAFRTDAQPGIAAESQPGADAQCDPRDSKCRPIPTSRIEFRVSSTLIGGGS